MVEIAEIAGRHQAQIENKSRGGRGGGWRVKSFLLFKVLLFVMYTCFLFCRVKIYRPSARKINSWCMLIMGIMVNMISVQYSNS